MGSSKLKPSSKPVSKSSSAPVKKTAPPGAPADPKKKASAPSRAALAGGFGDSLSALVTGGAGRPDGAGPARSDASLSVASTEKSAAAAVAAKRSQPGKKSPLSPGSPASSSAPAAEVSPAPLDVATLAAKDIPFACKLWNNFMRDRAPKWVLTQAEIDSLVIAAPPVIAKYFPQVELGPEWLLGACLLSIVGPRVEIGRPAAQVLRPAPAAEAPPPEKPPAEEAAPPVNPLSVFYPDGVPPEMTRAAGL